ncbi:hypothetical protein AB9M10_15645 [Rhodococcus erythropolis]
MFALSDADSDSLTRSSEPSNHARTFGSNCCKARWTGSLTSHCAGCHHTFTGLASFDRHRRAGQCLAPDTAGLEDAGRAYPCWGGPRGE